MGTYFLDCMIMRQMVVSTILTEKEYEHLTFVIKNAWSIGENLYPFYESTYDEDAGVYTDYGMNKSERTFAQIYFRDSLSKALIDVEFIDKGKPGEPRPRPYDVKIYFGKRSEAVLNHALWTYATKPDLQKKLQINDVRNLWETDGHYGPKPYEEWEKEALEGMAFKPQEARVIRKKLDQAEDEDTFFDYLISQQDKGRI